MDSDQKLVLRIAVGSPDGPYSSTLRIWSPAHKSDVYASVRERGGDFKISLHGDGTCQAGLTSEFAARETKALASLGGSRHQSRWTRVTHAGSRFVTPLQFSLPTSELRSWRPHPINDSRIIWIESPGSGHSVIVTCGLSGQMLPDQEWPGRRNGTHLLATKCLANGEKLWLLWQDCLISELETSMLADARELLRGPGMVHFNGIDEHTPLAPRILIFKDLPRERTLVVLDAAAA